MICNDDRLSVIGADKSLLQFGRHQCIIEGEFESVAVWEIEAKNGNCNLSFWNL